MQGLKEQKTPSLRRQAAAAFTAWVLPTTSASAATPNLQDFILFSAFNLNVKLPQQPVFHSGCERLQYMMWLLSKHLAKILPLCRGC